MKILNYAKGSKYKNGVIKPTYENKKYDVLLISLLRRYYCCKMKLNKTQILYPLPLKIKHSPSKPQDYTLLQYNFELRNLHNQYSDELLFNAYGYSTCSRRAGSHYSYSISCIPNCVNPIESLLKQFRDI